jgi:hypothetical protein
MASAEAPGLIFGQIQRCSAGEPVLAWIWH